MTFEAIINVECSSLYTAQDAKKNKGYYIVKKYYTYSHFRHCDFFD